jgi:hypothetical protein
VFVAHGEWERWVTFTRIRLGARGEQLDSGGALSRADPAENLIVGEAIVLEFRGFATAPQASVGEFTGAAVDKAPLTIFRPVDQP